MNLPAPLWQSRAFRRSARLWLFVLGFAIVFSGGGAFGRIGAANGQEPGVSRSNLGPANENALINPPDGVSSGSPLSSAELATKIDLALTKRWEAEQVVPASPADDAEFLRRINLDLVGKIPSVFEVRDFIADTRPDKRALLVETLLTRAGYATHFAATWREIILPGASSNIETRGLVPPFEDWLRLRFAANTHWDRLATELITANLATNQMAQPLSPFANNASAPSPLAFYQINEQKPENLASATSRVMFGVQLQCAQCHDHFFAKWKRTEFWSFAAFFGGLETPADSQDTNSQDADNAVTPSEAGEKTVPVVANLNGRPSIMIPDTEVTVEASFLDGSQPDWATAGPRRVALARWATGRRNPFFAKAAVNRVWEHFFGRGLVEPVDDLDPANKPSHPELFEEIALQFVLHDYDFKYLASAFAATRAYQLTSRKSHASQDDPQLFARMPMRRLTAEQLFDSLSQATYYRERGRREQALNPFGDSTDRSEFLAKFTNQTAKRSEAQTSILQALSLMNGKFIADQTGLEKSETLAAIVDSPFLSTPERIETMFLATLSRFPTTEESQDLVAFLAPPAGANSDQAGALADVFWALLNSAEFSLNH